MLELQNVRLQRIVKQFKSWEKSAGKLWVILAAVEGQTSEWRWFGLVGWAGFIQPHNLDNPIEAILRLEQGTVLNRSEFLITGVGL